jgi:hypothetical protein
MNPDTLRALPGTAKSSDEVRAILNAHADAWEAAEKRTARIVYAFNDCIALRNWDKGFEDYADVAELKTALAAGDTISDGYQTWDKRCAMCGKDTMQVVRVGKVQCSECG